MPYFPPASSSSVTPPFRNRLINGSWRFDQVKEGSAYTIAAAGGVTQAMDGWSGAADATGSFTMQRVADPDNASLFALKIACAVADASIGAGDAYYIQTAIEGYDVADLLIGTASAATITISFPMKMDVVGTYGVFVWNSAQNRNYVGTVTQNVASTREVKSVTLALDTTGTWLYTNGVGLYFGITLAAGGPNQTTAGTWQAASGKITTSAQCNFMSVNTNVGYIGRIQLERSATASAFEETSYQADLTRTQRHYSKTYDQGTAVGSATSNNCLSCQTPASTQGFMTFVQPVVMRAVPVNVAYSTVTGASGNVRNLSGAADVASTTLSTGTQNFIFYGTAAATSTLQAQATANARLS